jgi:hypothetical protein
MAVLTLHFGTAVQAVFLLSFFCVRHNVLVMAPKNTTKQGTTMVD